MNKIKVSVVYVNYKSFSELKKSIASINRYKSRINFEIIVVDNEGNKKVKKFLKKKKYTKYIKAPNNLGYAAGNNLGARYTQGKYIFILNPDTELLSNIIDKLAKLLDKNEDTAIAAPILIDSNGKVIKQLSSKPLTPIKYIFTYTFMAKFFPKNNIKEGFFDEVSDSNKPYEVDVVPGSALMIRKSVFEKLGGFDERYFMYFEDNDLCDAVRKEGYKIFKVPGVKVVHDWKPADGSEKLKKIFEKSRFYYFRKHFGIFSAIIVEAFSRRWWKFYEK